MCGPSSTTKKRAVRALAGGVVPRCRRGADAVRQSPAFQPQGSPNARAYLFGRRLLTRFALRGLTLLARLVL